MFSLLTRANTTRNHTIAASFARDISLGEKVTLCSFGQKQDTSKTFRWGDTDGMSAFMKENRAAKSGTSVLIGRTAVDLYRKALPSDIVRSHFVAVQVYGDRQVAFSKMQKLPKPTFAVGFRGGVFVGWKLAGSVIAPTAFELSALLAERIGGKPTMHVPLPGCWRPEGDTPEELWFSKGLGHSVSDLSGQGLLSAPNEEKKMTRADRMTVPAMSWLWPGFIPEGNLSLIMGEPGVGKSQMAMDIAARITRGGDWPDGTPGKEPGNVVMIETEDALGDTLARADAAEANRKRMIVWNEAFDLSTPEGIAELERDISDFQDIAALVLSPFGMFFGEIRSYKDTDIRRSMVALLSWAEKRNIAIIGVMHKGAGSKGRSAEDAAGPQAFGRRARVILSALIDINDPEFKRNPKRARRILASAKANNSRDDLELPYKITGVTLPDGTSSSRVQWLDAGRTGETGKSDNVVQMGKPPKTWLLDRLANGAEPAAVIEREAEERGIARATLYRAKKQLNVVSDPRGFGGAAKWRLPD